MKHIDINDTFHRLVKDGSTAERAWKKLANALMNDDLKLWCNGEPIALDYLNTSVKFILRDGDFVAWPAGGGMGWNPYAYTFTIDAEQFERLLARRPVGRPHKVTTDQVKAARGTTQKMQATNLGVTDRTIRRHKKRTK